MKVGITYMSGAGNLFSVIDNRIFNFSKDKFEELAKILCNINEFNKFQTEGLMLINDPLDSYTNFHVDFINPDGSTGMMCGNGGRVALKFAAEKRIISPRYYSENFFSMAGNVYKGILHPDSIVLFLPAIKKYTENINLEIDDMNITGDYVNVSTDHFVIDFNSIKSSINQEFADFEINKIAPKIRYNEYFSPKGTNVNFFEDLSDNTFNLRTYERGVEAETGACGTGAIATAFVAVYKKSATFPIKIIPSSKKMLIVDVIGSFPNDIESVSLEGGAEILYELIVDIPDYFINM